MKKLIWILLISLPVFADVNTSDQAPKRPKASTTKTVDLNKTDYQTETDEIRGTEIEHQRQMEEELKNGLEQEDDELKTQKDF